MLGTTNKYYVSLPGGGRRHGVGAEGDLRHAEAEVYVYKYIYIYREREAIRENISECIRSYHMYI